MTAAKHTATSAEQHTTAATTKTARFREEPGMGRTVGCSFGEALRRGDSQKIGRTISAQEWSSVDFDT
jgi:hypothetical protein